MKKYKVILSDPPWAYRNAGCRGAAANEYSTMTIDDICALPVASMADDDCVLLLWGTWPQMPEALQVVNSWGFQYVTGFPWVKVTEVSHTLWGDLTIKVPYGIGFWARGTTELLLIARRGNVTPPTEGFIGLLSPNLHHSRKPDDIYHYAESLQGPYLEMFARRPRAGWDSWGNEIQSTVTLAAAA